MEKTILCIFCLLCCLALSLYDFYLDGQEAAMLAKYNPPIPGHP